MEQPYRVYIVEDSPAILKVVTSSLESSGTIQVIGHADTWQSALNDLDSMDADTVIIDLALRGGSGFDLLRRLALEERYAPIKKIVLTNHGTEMFRKRALSLGADYFFDKSLEFDQVIELLEGLADQRKNSQGA